MLHTSTQKLIQKICELTESSDIAWKEAAEGRCRFETEGYQIEVAEEPPLVRLLSPEGRELEKAEAADLAIAWPGGDGTFATHVADMARRAHRVARGAEHAITRILSSLSAPPKKSFVPPEPEPMPAAIEFDQPQSQPQPYTMTRKPQQQSAGESAASIAALNADMVSQRRQPEPPPSPHTAPAPQPAPPPRPQTAIDTVLAAEASAPEAEPAIAAAEEELPLEDAPPAPAQIEPSPVQAAPAQVAWGQPAPHASAPPVEDAKPALTDAPSFAQAQPPRPSAPLAKPASNLFMTGFSAVSRPAPRPEPQPAPAPAPAAKAAPEPPAQPPTPAPQPEPPRAPEMAAPAKPPRTGQDIYKPW